MQSPRYCYVIVVVTDQGAEAQIRKQQEGGRGGIVALADISPALLLGSPVQWPSCEVRSSPGGSPSEDAALQDSVGPRLADRSLLPAPFIPPVHPGSLPCTLVEEQLVPEGPQR